MALPSASLLLVKISLLSQRAALHCKHDIQSTQKPVSAATTTSLAGLHSAATPPTPACAGPCRMASSQQRSSTPLRAVNAGRARARTWNHVVARVSAAGMARRTPPGRGREAAAETRRRAGSAESRHRRDLARTMETPAPARTAAVEMCAANMAIALDSATELLHHHHRLVLVSQHARSQRHPWTPASSWWLASFLAARAPLATATAAAIRPSVQRR